VNAARLTKLYVIKNKKCGQLNCSLVFDTGAWWRLPAVR